MHAPADIHWVANKRILHYLKGMVSISLHITCSSFFSLHGFVDGDWTSNIDNHKSTDSYLVFFGHTPISWKSGKQRIVVRSSTEVEYKALANDTSKVI